jgi:hypothetical protein
MAQSDFDLVNFGPLTPVGGVAGQPLVHSLLSSPLALNGIYGRGYRMTSGNPAIQTTGWFAFVAAAAFVGTPLTKAVSLRAMVRHGAAGDDGTTSAGCGVSARVPTNGNGGGYHLLLGTLNAAASTQFHLNNTDWGASAIGLRLHRRKPTGERDTSFAPITIPGTYSANVWYAIRLDVTPFSTSHDILETYTGVQDDQGSITWTLQNTTNCQASDTVYNPPTSTTRVGYTCIHANPS